MDATLRDGRFVLLQPIGEGAQGRTFDGLDKRPPHGAERAVAIKRFDVRGATSWKDVELAEREARVLQSLSHPRLPAYVDHFEQDGGLYLVMEKIDGESLGAMRKRGASLGENEVVRLLRDASEVLDYLHRRVPPTIHRDLKPGNVIMRPGGSFAFVDFGAVRDKLRPKGGSTVVGTFGYMAPEQMQGRALPASDVYAIGATALAMLTGCEPEDLPHRGLAIDVRQALRRTDGPGRAGRAVETRVSPGLVEVLERMLDPDPDRRASRIAPLLARLDRRGSSRQDGRSTTPVADWSTPDQARQTRSELWADRQRRHAQRRARKAARRAERAARRVAGWRGARSHPFPWPVRLVLSLLFTVAIVVVSLATQVVVPVVLGLLSLLLARRPLTTAAEAVRHAGDVAIRGMDQSRRWFLGGDGQSPADQASQSRTRVEGSAAPGEDDSVQRTRVAESEDAPAALDEQADSASPSEMHRPARR